MKIAPLGEVARFIRGVTFKPSDVVHEPSRNVVGVMRTKNVQQELDLDDVVYIPKTLAKRQDQMIRSGDTLISSANSWAIVGKCCWVPDLTEDYAIGGFITGIRVISEHLDARYLYRWLSSPRTQAVLRSTANQTTNIANLNLRRCEALEVPLPPIVEQRRIAAILDQADALRATRSQAMKMLDNLAQATFRELFGDPVVNDRGWKRIPLENVVSGITSGQSPVCEARPAQNGEWAVLKLGAVSYGRFNASENKAFLGDIASIKRVEVRPGDFLLSRKNTKELVGASVVVDEVPPHRLLPDLIFRIDLIDDQVEAHYLHGLLTNPRKRPQLVSLASGSASSMSNISQARLLGLNIEVPPIGLQREYSAQVRQIDRLRGRYVRDLSELDNLVASLQFCAFSAQL